MIVSKKFNDLELSELYQILRLRSEVFVVEQDCVYQDVDGKDEEAVHVFYVKDDTVISCLRIYGADSSEQHIGRVVSSVHYRGSGISRALMLSALDYLRANQTQKVLLSGQKYLRGFYESLGFSVVTDEYLEDGIPHFGMELIL